MICKHCTNSKLQNRGFEAVEEEKKKKKSNIISQVNLMRQVHLLGFYSLHHSIQQFIYSIEETTFSFCNNHDEIKLYFFFLQCSNA